MLVRRRASLVKFLCLLPFMVSLLVPVGMMPAVSSSGAFTLVICHGHAAEKHLPDGKSEKGASSWCPFSLLSAAVLLPVRIGHDQAIQDAIVLRIGFVDREVPATKEAARARPRGPPTIL